MIHEQENIQRLMKNFRGCLLPMYFLTLAELEDFKRHADFMSLEVPCWIMCENQLYIGDSGKIVKLFF